MAFTVKQVNELYLLDTKLENIFISEFMAAAPGDYVKVYILSLMYANSGVDTGNEAIAKQLGLEEEDVLKAWNYWESLGAISKHLKDSKNKFDYDVEFLCIREQLYGKKTKKKSGGEIKLPPNMSDSELKDMFDSIQRITGRLPGGKEPAEILSWIGDYGASPAVVVYAYSYCMKNNKDNYKYVGSVIKGWMEKQLCEVGEIETHLQETDRRHFLYKRVMKALGLARNATEKEKRIMDTWFDDMGHTIERVLEACGKTAGISNPNINYVNSVLVNWHTEKTTGQKPGKPGKKTATIADVHKYYDMIRKQAEDEAEEKKAQIYSQVPEIKEIDAQLRACGMEMSKIMISGNPSKKQQANSCKSKADKLSAQKADLLAQAGHAADYLETKYRCGICMDTGLDDNGERCGCFAKVQSEAELWRTSLIK
ncbi:MAG: DnaD domain protein [Clostridiales bacterium]|nr:DnaD domain protein [Clostridiales bacterium]